MSLWSRKDYEAGIWQACTQVSKDLFYQIWLGSCVYRLSYGMSKFYLCFSIVSYGTIYRGNFACTCMGPFFSKSGLLGATENASPVKMQYHENDGPNRSPGICKTWKRKDRIAGARKSGKCRTNSILKSNV